MLAASASQCTCRSGARAVAGTVKSKSCATTAPASVGEENVPPAAPLKVAKPFTWNGRLAGPPSAATNGRHSARLEVATERRSEESAESVPEACTLDAGVDTAELGEFQRVARGAICALNMRRHRQLPGSGMRRRAHVERERHIRVLRRSLPSGIDRARGKSDGMELAQRMRRRIQRGSKIPRRNIAQTKMHRTRLHSRRLLRLLAFFEGGPRRGNDRPDFRRPSSPFSRAEAERCAASSRSARRPPHSRRTIFPAPSTT